MNVRYVGYFHRTRTRFNMGDNVSAMRIAGLRGTHYQTTQSLRARQDARI